MIYQTSGWFNHNFWTSVAQEKLEMVIKGQVGCFPIIQRETSTILGIL